MSIYKIMVNSNKNIENKGLKWKIRKNERDEKK